MTKFIDFNDLATGTIVDNEYRSDGVTISASGGANLAMIFDTSNPTGGDHDLATSNLGNVLIISEDGDQHDPDDNGRGGTFTLDFDGAVTFGSLTFLDIEESAKVRFYDAHGSLIKEVWIDPTGDNGQKTVDFDVEGVANATVTLKGSGAIDNLSFTPAPQLDGIVEGTDGDDLIDTSYTGDPDGDMIDNNDEILPGEGPNDDIVIAGDGNDTILAGEGNDDVKGEGGNDSINGGDGDDSLDGGTGNDRIFGGKGNDTQIGGDGDDTLGGADAGDDLFIGGAGDDMVEASTGNDTIDGGTGNDNLWASSDDDSVTGGDGDDYIHGGTGNDTLHGGKDNDTISGGSDDDSITGGKGDDLLQGDVRFKDDNGDAGDDTINGGNGNDTILGEGGNDSLLGGAGNDSLEGGDGDDRIFGGDGNDTQIGGDGNDTLGGADFGDDLFIGGAGDDMVEASFGNDTIDGGTGNDNLWASSDDDSVDGGEGDDYIHGGTGKDTIDGGADNDTISGGSDDDLISGGTGDDLLQGDIRFKDDNGAAGDDTISGGDGDDTILGEGGDDILRGDNGDDVIDGGDGNDMVFGGNGNDSLSGGDGDDKLEGSKGNDTLEGGAGADDIWGGKDEDLIIVSSASDANGDSVDGGDGGTDFDILDLTGAGPFFLDNVTPDSNGNGINGTVVFVDTDGVPTGEILTFEEIEKVIGDEVGRAPITEDDVAETDEDTPVVIDPLANDSDPDGDPLTIGEATSPDGTVEINPDGTITFTPDPDFNGETTITYTAVDPDGNETPGTITVTVNPINDAPDAINDTAETDEETPVTIDVLANDVDPDDDPLTITAASVPTVQGTVEVVDGQLVFTPAEDFTGTATISYSITDGNGGTDVAEVVVTVNNDNDAPIAVDDLYETMEEEPVTFDPTENDEDVDGDPLTVTDVDVPAEQGTAVINPDGTVTFTPAPDFNGPAEITYIVDDGNGGTDEGKIIVNVGSVNDGPTANDDADTTDEDTPITIDALANDVDPDNTLDELTITVAIVPPTQGTAEVVDGKVVYTPAEDFNGEAEIEYSITDPDGGTSSAIITVTVNPVNDDPVALDDIENTDEDTPVVVDLLGNDTDIDGDPLTLVEVSVPPEQGTVVDNGDGTVTFTPAPNFNGPATISYTVSDGNGGEDEATATVNVGAVNDSPDAVDDSDTTPEDTPITVDLLANDTDPDGDPLTVISATVPEEEGTLVDNGDGTVTFTPAPDFNGDATITYTISDGNGLTDTAEHVITVTPTDDAPVVVDDTAETDEDTPVVIDPLANDSDPDGDPLTVGEATSPDGTVEINPDGTITFTPDPDFNGPTTISYTAVDPDGNETPGTITVNVVPVNDGPDAVDDSDTTEEDTPITVDLLANDSDPDGDPLTVVSATVPAEEGTLVDNGDGTVTFTPAPDFNGEATITYTIEDPDGEQDTAEHVITVTPTDDAPVVVDDTAETDEDTPVVIDPLANDSDPDGDPLTVGEATSPDGTVEINPDGTITFTPDPDFNGPTTISYTAVDPDGNETPGTITVNVVPVNDAPEANDDSETTPFNTPVVIPVLDNDDDPDGDPLTVIAATSPDGTVEINPDGTITFTPNDGFEGPATINYTIEDPEGLTDDAVVTVLVEDEPLDGIVEGTDGDDLIDTNYVGDPQGDMIDNNDEILPGEGPNDDIVIAGAGDDTVLAGEGDDDVSGGDGDDVIDGGEGDDILLGDDGNDTIDGGEGNDTVEGGDGDDLIDTANDSPLLFDRGFPGVDAQVPGVPDLGPLDPDPDPENDRDSVDGGDGDDTIRTGDDRDTITGGDGADVIDAGIDDDIIDGGANGDRIVGGEGSDIIEGGAGADTIYAGNDPDLGLDVFDIEDDGTGIYEADPLPDNGKDTVDGGAGADLIFGADDDDVLSGGSGNDTIDGEIDDDLISGDSGDDSLLGGQGDDTIDGGTGDDLIDGGIGEDSLSGGADQDTFVNVNAGDEVDGGSAGDDFDVLDLRGSAPEGGSLQVTETGPDSNGNGVDGFVTYFDENGDEVGRLDFTEIEEVIPCFTPGTKIATPRGEVRVEDLEVGDMVITRDNGMQEVRWTGQREMSAEEFVARPNLRPVLIRRGALGHGLPEQDMMVSPNHRVLLASDQAELLFEEREVLVAAKHLVGIEGIEIAKVFKATYIHIMFDQHEVILSDGAWTESFQPGDMSLKGVDKAQRDELLALFPELETEAGIAAYAAARRILKKHEAHLLRH